MARTRHDAEWFWTDRWMGSSARELPMEARGLYREMLTSAWRRGANLPANHEAIRRLTACTEAEWDRCWPAIKGYWEETGNGCLVNETQVEVYQKTLQLSETRAKAGSAGGKSSAKHRATAKQKREQPVEQAPQAKSKPPVSCLLSPSQDNGPTDNVNELRTPPAPPPEPQPEPEALNPDDDVSFEDGDVVDQPAEGTHEFVERFSEIENIAKDRNQAFAPAKDTEPEKEVDSRKDDHPEHVKAHLEAHDAEEPDPPKPVEAKVVETGSAGRLSKSEIETDEKGWSMAKAYGEAGDDWEVVFPGSVPAYKRIGQAFRPWIRREAKRRGIEPREFWEDLGRAAWQNYLTHADPDYCNPQGFVQKPWFTPGEGKSRQKAVKSQIQDSVIDNWVPPEDRT